MTRLIHVNGPPGIGKSTIAALYASRHPGTLNLDIDTLHGLVGGWQDPDNQTHQVLRPVARAMAAAHLEGGRDVVLPQYLARAGEIRAFEEVARSRGADFREFILLDTKEEAVARFDHRDDDTPWGRHNRRTVLLNGGPVMLAEMYDRLLEIARERSSAVIIRSEEGAIEATYALVAESLAP